MCSQACFDNATIFLVRDGWLTQEELSVVSQLDPEFDVMVKTVPHLLKINFSSLLDPCLDYEDQEKMTPIKY